MAGGRNDKRTEGDDHPQSLREALRGHFDKPWSALPPALADRARSVLWPWWDKLSEAERIRLAREADRRSAPAFADEFRRQDEIAERIFNLRAEIRDLERRLDSNEPAPTRDELICDEVNQRLEAGEQGVFKAVAAKYRISEKTARNIVARRRALLGQSRSKRKR